LGENPAYITAQAYPMAAAKALPVEYQLAMATAYSSAMG
jgi:hypothetical protein